jgi:hypothetical protein
MDRVELIELCKRSVVHYSKWRNRDSYSAQLSIKSIYKGLTAGLDFRIVTKAIDPEYHSTTDTLIIEFLQPIDFEKLNNGVDLEISTREQYFKNCDPERESEMFDGEGIDFFSSYTKTYMPSMSRIQEANGDDWY